LATKEKSNHCLKIQHSEGVLRIGMASFQHLAEWKQRLQELNGAYCEVKKNWTFLYLTSKYIL